MRRFRAESHDSDLDLTPARLILITAQRNPPLLRWIWLFSRRYVFFTGTFCFFSAFFLYIPAHLAFFWRAPRWTVGAADFSGGAHGVTLRLGGGSAIVGYGRFFGRSIGLGASRDGVPFLMAAPYRACIRSRSCRRDARFATTGEPADHPA